MADKRDLKHFFNVEFFNETSISWTGSFEERDSGCENCGVGKPIEGEEFCPDCKDRLEGVMPCKECGKSEVTLSDDFLCTKCYNYYNSPWKEYVG